MICTFKEFLDIWIVYFIYIMTKCSTSIFRLNIYVSMTLLFINESNVIWMSHVGASPNWMNQAKVLPEKPWALISVGWWGSPLSVRHIYLIGYIYELRSMAYVRTHHHCDVNCNLWIFDEVRNTATLVSMLDNAYFRWIVISRGNYNKNILMKSIILVSKREISSQLILSRCSIIH